jgi:ATP-binding cassette subfamily B protein
MIRRFAKYYRPYLGVFFLDLLAAALVAGCNLVLPLCTRAMLNSYIKDSNLKMVLTLAGVLLGLYLGKVALNYYMACQGHIMSAQMQADMRRDLFHKLEYLPCTFFDNHKTGALMSRMTSDLFDVSELAHHGPEDLFISAAQFIGAFIILFGISPALTLISFAVIPPMVFIVTKLRRRLGNSSRESRVKTAELNAGLENSISGVRVSRAFNAQGQEEAQFAVNNAAYVETRKLFCRAMGTFNGWMTFCTDFLSLLVLTVGGVLIIRTGKLDYVDLVTFMLYVSVFTQPITKMVGFTEQYENGMTGFARFCEIMDEEEEQEEPDALPAPPLRGEIRFDGVSFSYETGAEVLHDMSFTVEAGTTVALVGSSGGGKTTVCHLIPRFYERTAGTVTIDGTDIRHFTRASLRAQIGMVAQDVFLFNATIYENIAYGSEHATPEAVAEAARRARLDDYIATLPLGYQTVVGERGVKLSGGQKQRIAIARVFLKNPPILILDEATSALDNITEHQIQQSLRELCRGRTTIVVAHRLTTVRDADEIMYIEDGRILERGTHESLMAQGGEYSRLVMSTYPGEDEGEQTRQAH